MISIRLNLASLKFIPKPCMCHGSYFIDNSFLIVQKWEPTFVASDQHFISYIAIWARLTDLPTEFDDLEILSKIGYMIG